jgi:hypothetical protein
VATARSKEDVQWDCVAFAPDQATLNLATSLKSWTRAAIPSRPPDAGQGEAFGWSSGRDLHRGGAMRGWANMLSASALLARKQNHSQRRPIRPATELYNVSVGKP